MSAETAAAAFTDDSFVAAYEALRRQAIEGGWHGAGFGTLVARGLRCWLEVCGPLLDPPSTQPPVPSRADTALPPAVRDEVVILLAGILLHRAWKVIA